MIRALLQRLHAWLGGLLKEKGNQRPVESSDFKGLDPSTVIAVDGRSNLVSIDEDLLDRTKTQWQCADWEGLIKLTEKSIEHHPDRAKLALLAAAAHQQIGTMDETRAMVRLALDWGCKPKLVRQILISGTHNTLARAAAIMGNERRALEHFEAAVESGSRHSDRVVARLRIESELTQLGLPVAAIARETRLKLVSSGREGTA